MARDRRGKRRVAQPAPRGRAAPSRRESFAWTAAAGAVLALGVLWAVVNIIPPRRSSPADPENPEQVALGASLYAAECGQCHGVRLEGQANWQTPGADGRYPAPPHDESGHTWHHSDEHLFRIVKHGGQTPGSNMPAFAGKLSDADVWATLAFIKSRWPDSLRRRQPASRQ